METNKFLHAHQNSSMHMHIQQPYHPVAQDWLPNEAKQSWACSVPGWETFWEN